MSQIPPFSTTIGRQLEALALAIQLEPKHPASEIRLGYFETLLAIHAMTQPLFDQIAELAERAGFGKIEAFQAWPKALCENFVLAAIDDSEKITHVILAKNKKHGFLQNGGGKTGVTETSEQAAFREAQEEFGFKGSIEQLRKVTLESESGMPIFHFVKGVHIALITQEQITSLKLADDMASNEMVCLTAEEFLQVTAADTKPIDHGFDRKWIAEYIKANNKSDLQYMTLQKRTFTEEDYRIATKAREWIDAISVNTEDLDHLKKLIQQFIDTDLPVQTIAEGPWKSEKNRELVKKAAQRVIDAVVQKLLPHWKFMGKKGDETACQVKVQDAVGIAVNSSPLPSFLTISQMAILQSALFKIHHIEIVSISNSGGLRNIITKSVTPFSS